MIKWIKKWYLRKLEEKYNNKTIVIPEADIKYPPPSEYEVRQLIEELGIKRKPSKLTWETPPNFVIKKDISVHNEWVNTTKKDRT